MPTVDTTGLALVIGVLKRLVLPLSTLTLANLGPIYRVSRSALVSELQEDYVLMAEAKGSLIMRCGTGWRPDVRGINGDRHAESERSPPSAAGTRVPPVPAG